MHTESKVSWPVNQFVPDRNIDEWMDMHKLLCSWIPRGWIIANLIIPLLFFFLYHHKVIWYTWQGNQITMINPIYLALSSQQSAAEDARQAFTIIHHQASNFHLHFDDLPNSTTPKIFFQFKTLHTFVCCLRVLIETQHHNIASWFYLPLVAAPVLKQLGPISGNNADLTSTDCQTFAI